MDNFLLRQHKLSSSYISTSLIPFTIYDIFEHRFHLLKTFPTHATGRVKQENSCDEFTTSRTISLQAQEIWKNVTHSYKAKMYVKHAFWYITCVSYSFGLNIMLYICYIKSLVQGSKPFSQLIKCNFLSYWQTKLSVCIWK